MKGDVMGAEQPSNEKFLEWLIELMKDGPPVERRVPKNLKDRFKRALFRYWKMGTKDELMELRECDASNFRKCIAVWGVLNIGAPVPDLDLRPFPLGYHEAAKELREVFDELSHFLNGGAEDFCAAPITAIVEGELNSKSAKHAADMRHSKPGGSRDKQTKIRLSWASGKYTNRDICAEQEGAHFGFGSFKTARNALKGTDDPNPWPAKSQ